MGKLHLLKPTRTSIVESLCDAFLYIKLPFQDMFLAFNFKLHSTSYGVSNKLFYDQIFKILPLVSQDRRPRKYLDQAKSVLNGLCLDG